MFDGKTYDDSRDRARLLPQLDYVRTVLSDGQWHTLADLAEGTNWSSAALSARIRDLRKPKFGGYAVESQYVSRGLWRYRINS